MRQLPKAIPELDGGLFLPRQVVDLLEVVLDEHDRMLQAGERRESRVVLGELRELLRMTGARPSLPSARDQLGLADPQQEMLARNLTRG
ncbi:hypothetical protein [Ramlibacter rhizophilus]|uniref:Uncharacterized protein n=1 Tax=Ramlibacter rhizophilus TaxID=1781167 RepID=A0A4Z0BKC6_9BURK|nr:hypothetical protein [Ramlibacter rhizophilus]TFY98534.1 hypothetical protein EZ242_13420 [Ramlibacter rhizophilus]